MKDKTDAARTNFMIHSIRLSLITINCPLWRNKVELPARGDIISAVKAAEKIAFAKQTSITRDQWQDAEEVM